MQRTNFPLGINKSVYLYVYLIWPQDVFHSVKHIRNINVFIYLKGYFGSQQTNMKYLTLKLGKQYLY